MKSGTHEIRDSYDTFPYHSFAYPDTAPENLAVIARLFGIDAPDVREARVLELGCASGGNVMPFAVRNPRARVTGIDLSEVQIGEGRRRIDALGLRNIDLRALDLTSITKSFGEFDYIVCHGLYSWVPDEARAAILRICRDNLAPDGVACVSYKTYPGWKAHEIVRDAMLFRAGREGDTQRRLALGRGMIDFLHTCSRRDSVLAKAIEQDRELIARADANYIAHDYLAGFNKPCYFVDFVTEANAHGMTYVAEAAPPAMFAANYGEDIARPLLEECAGDQVLLEQYLDFIGDRSFRSTLIVHGERRGAIDYRLDGARLRELHVAASLNCEDGEVRFDSSKQAFRASSGAVVVLDRPAGKAAAVALLEAAPFTLSFEQLRDAVRERIGNAADAELEATLTAFVESIVMRGLGRYRLAPVVRRGAMPRVSDAARGYPALLSDGQVPHTFNEWHEPVVLNAASQTMLPYIDGTRTRAALLAMLEQAVKEGLTLGESSADVVLDRILRELCA